MNPILKNITTNMETDRLMMRRPEPGDGQVINEAVIASINELKPWLGFAQEEPSVEETEINNREAHIAFLQRESFRFLLFHKQTGEFVGTTGLSDINWDVPKMEIGYWIATIHSGKGYMTEAIDKLTDFAMEELGCRRIMIRCDAKNEKSRSIPERLGFQLEGILRNDDTGENHQDLTDTCVYSKIK
ncbi:GNAT family N-acetyltransferase [Pontibacillus salicampi]|uniref:GNAT family N-acetyltransferase n=1 Tax=Pontibacillus salicampi TaxID=1449801 RepID=A0ABV6LM02_9BACI